MPDPVDFLVIGSGIAGLTFALKAAKHGTVALVTKRSIDECNTRYAQGGIAAVVDPGDSFEGHIKDTEIAGAGLCKTEVVELCIEDGPKRIAELVALGVKFSRKSNPDGSPGPYDLGREGGHHARRVLHAGDITGAEIERALVVAVQEAPNIEIYERHCAVNLVTNELVRSNDGQITRVIGAHVLNVETETVETFPARLTVLASGGIGKVYLFTSNPDVATGDGIAMAYRIGAKIANMEFVQFHPTCLFHPKAKNFLISEALRGEGGELINTRGDAFMKDVHELGSLAPRDIVARAIDAELKNTGADSVFLDMTHLSRDFIESRFPTINATCRSFGIDMAVAPIPVVPAAHYACGGVLVDTSGRSSVPGLYAIGEVSCSGLHGANRLASNSLLEGAVYADRAAAHAIKELRDAAPIPPPIPAWDATLARPSDERVIVTHDWEEIRRTMWHYVGIVRTNRRLFRARRRIDLIQSEIREYYWDFEITRDFIELRNLATVARLVVECALRRRESRGLNYNLDYPHRDDEQWQRDTIVDRLMLEGV